MPTGKPTIASTALALINERGPLTGEELVPAIVAAGRTKAKNPLAAVRAALQWNPEFLEHSDGRFFSLAAQLEGAVFAVRPTRLERNEGVILLRDDLALVEQLLRRGEFRHRPDEIHIDWFREYFDLPDVEPAWAEGLDDEDDGPGRAALGHADELDLHEALGADLVERLLDFLDELGVPRGEDDANLRELIAETRMSVVLHGPEGWLPALRPRQLLGLVVEGGALRTIAVDRLETTRPAAATATAKIGAIARALLVGGPGEELMDDPVIPIDELLELIAMEAPELLRTPLPPFVEVLENAGLDVEDGLVGLPEPEVDGPVRLGRWRISTGAGLGVRELLN